jgi:hypothetical protein|tara:strand:- start:228 stop:1256 length:1029 start_codon:yes stop_codon:yes gene_type:complete
MTWRPRLKKDEQELIRKYRGIKRASKEAGVNVEDVKHGWLKTKEASLFFNNPSFKDERFQQLEKLKDSLLEDIKQYSPSFPKILRSPSKDGHLLVVDPADIHIGKLADSFETGESYNNQIAVKRVKEGVQGILDKATGFNIDQILFIGGNDILHIDQPGATSKGTRQDVDGMWYSNFLIAKNLYVDVLEILLAIAPVHFTFNPSNHDMMSGFFLSDVIKTWFKNCDDMTFDCSMAHRKSYTYGKNLIGTTHGDGAKTQDLPLLMATEFPLEWAKTKHRYVYTHHVHHKFSKDMAGCTIESLRSPSATDSWHHKKGYQHAPQACEGFLHSKLHGQVARLTHLF